MQFHLLKSQLMGYLKEEGMKDVIEKVWKCMKRQSKCMKSECIGNLHIQCMKQNSTTITIKATKKGTAAKSALFSCV